MSKTKLREEYEAMFGAVVGVLKLFDADNNQTYYEDSDGWWSKYEYDDNNNQTYYENSSGVEIYYETSRSGVIKDNRTCSDKVFIDEQSGKKFKMTEVK